MSIRQHDDDDNCAMDVDDAPAKRRKTNDASDAQPASTTTFCVPAMPAANSRMQADLMTWWRQTCQREHFAFCQRLNLDGESRQHSWQLICGHWDRHADQISTHMQVHS